MKKTFYVLGMLVMFAAGGVFNRYSHRTDSRIVCSDTIVVRDTVTVSAPLPVAEIPAGTLSVVVHADSVLVDSAVTADSVVVVLPKISRRYSGEHYDAYVSGVNPQLDSLRLYTDSYVVCQSPRHHAAGRWSVGFGAGMAMTPRGFQPYIGVGVSFRLFGL